MGFHGAYLVRKPIENSGDRVNDILSFDLAFRTSPRDDVAVLKARTLLAFLHSHDMLQTTRLSKGDIAWDVYHKTDTLRDPEGLLSTMAAILPNTESEVDAVIGIDYTGGNTKQPGIIAVRDDIVAKTIFLNSFLESSTRWLKTRPEAMSELLEAFNIEERKAG